MTSKELTLAINVLKQTYEFKHDRVSFRTKGVKNVKDSYELFIFENDLSENFNHLDVIVVMSQIFYGRLKVNSETNKVELNLF